MEEKLLLNKTNLLLSIALLVLIVFNISLLNYKILTPTANNNEIKKQYEENMAKAKEQEQAEQERISQSAMTEEEIKEERMTDLKSMGEADRMYTYFFEYLGMVEWENYEEAYNILYDDFKKQYYPTIDSYISYVKKTYPPIMSIRYENIERQGEYYILTVLIRSSVDPNGFTPLRQRFILHENGFDEFELSFQVI